MLKTIKIKKQMRLDELIKYIFDNGIEDKVFPSNGGSSFDMCEARISGSGNIKMSGYINEHTTFTVEIEEPITEDTVFDNLIEVTKNDNALHYNRTNISDVANRSSKRFYALINGKLELVWERDGE